MKGTGLVSVVGVSVKRSLRWETWIDVTATSGRPGVWGANSTKSAVDRDETSLRVVRTAGESLLGGETVIDVRAATRS